MSVTICILMLFWAFITGFLLGISFIDFKKKPITIKTQDTSRITDDFSIINEEYRNFLNYDGSKQ